MDFKGLFAAIDAMDSERFLGFISEDATFRFGSAPPVQGHAEIRSAVDEFFASIVSLSHDLQRIVANENAVVYEGEVTYTRHDCTTVTLPFANVFEVDHGLVSLYRIYIDIGPLYTQ